MLKFKHKNKIRQGIEILPTEIYEGTIIPFENISYIIIGEGRGKFKTK